MNAIRKTRPSPTRYVGQGKRRARWTLATALAEIRRLSGMLDAVRDAVRARR